MYNVKNTNEQRGSLVLIDALYVNKSGAKILLDYLIKKLEKQNQKFYYLLDDRMARCDYDIKKTNQVLFLKATVWNRFSFYRKHRNKFSKVFCFGNIPPLIKFAVPVYTYFHHFLFASASITKEVLFRERIITKIKTLFLDRVKGNTDYWLVQSPTVGKGLVRKYGIKEYKILSMPFYESVTCQDSVKRIKNTFLYVSLGYGHKNHKRLIDAFCLFYDKYKIGELHLTISEDFESLFNHVIKLKENGYPIINHGFVVRREIGLLYHKCEFLIFPSLAETFGLGIIEAIQCGCKVLGADLPYMYEVCTPTDVFNPKSVQSIFEAMERAIKGNNKPTVPVIKNNINELVKLLTT